MKAILVLLLLTQQPEEEKKEVVVTATRSETETFDVPNSVDVIDRKKLLNERQPRSIPDALKETPGVLRQKTAQGQSSPFIRGFTGFRNLLLIDGIRLNNSVFRDGPNQYWSTIDPFTVERIEVLKGPASTLYGSDAIGGTVQLFTVSPSGYREEGVGVSPHLYGQYRSAEQAFLVRGELSATLAGKGGVIIGGSWRDFGNVDGGSGTGEQPNTDYFERNGDAKVEYFLSDDVRVVVAYQMFNQDDVWRTHKTTSGIEWHGTTFGDEQKRVLDQDRSLAYAQLHAENLGAFIDTARVSLSWHNMEEERFRIRSSGNRERQGIRVGTLGFWSQFESETDFGHITFGGEYYHDNVRSGKRTFDSAGNLTGVEIQGPVADDSEYAVLAAFVQNQIPIGEDWKLTLGLRFTHVAVDAGRYEDPVSGNPASLDEDWSNLAGNIRVLHHLNDEINLYGGLSQGFRAPNLSDLTRLDSARSNEIETPSPGLDPEEFLTLEIGTKVETEEWEGTLAVYYTLIDDMIIRRPTGNIISGDEEVIKENAGDGYVWGIELSGRVRLSDEVAAFGSVVYTRGEVDQYPSSAPNKEREPLSRVQPLTFMAGLRYEPEEKKVFIEGLITIADDQDRLSTGDKRDTDRIPNGGTPGYTVYTLRGGWQVEENMRLGIGIENVSNKDYRVHGSGVNEPGTSAILSLDVTW